MILGRRRTGLGGLFSRSRHGGLMGAARNHPKTSILGALATVAGPIVLRKLLANRRTAPAAGARV
ncbi:MAG: hypothetical protein JNL83_14165 [Myxococcales bacterium]|nr:hypothetical protein [Myxococcales bacterium]